jgi:hypothetical protein
MKLPDLIAACAFAFLAVMLALAPGVRAQEATTQTAALEPSAPALNTEELDQLVAPVALYSDKLLAQVLMASTYPLEVVEADRWAREHSSLKGEALLSALDKERWDPSVKSLVQVPQVLKMMSDKLDWTQRLGDAFLGQQKGVMDAVQRLRQLADKAGNLKSGEQQTIVRQPASSSGGATVVQSAPAETIIIQESSPDVIYVPSYNPSVVYGTWPYPSYPPYYWGSGYGYAPVASAFAWGVGVGITAAVWNDAFDWNGGDININNNVNINNRWRNDHNRGDWRHNAEHRRGVNYRDQRSREKFGKGDHRNVDARRDFRGRDGARGSRDTPRLSNRDVTGGRDGNRAGNRGSRDSQLGNRGGRNNQLGDRSGNRGNQFGDRSAGRQYGNRTGGSRSGQGGPSFRSEGAANRYGGGGNSFRGGRSGGFDGVGRGGQTRSFAGRGGASRGGMRGGGGRRR